MSLKVDMLGTCAFCGENDNLAESHVLPAFVFRWLRGRSGIGHMRQTDNPNKRVQDGLKFHWLCLKCEGQFSHYEGAFARLCCANPLKVGVPLPLDRPILRVA